uniref:C2H2-type domain-containing protein n=1 Tax=Glossina brevipalpis TaxID=37001 RepID=A0A1A9X339_9MUSC
MNDATFSNYESFFGTSANHQVNDLNALIQTMDYEIPSSLHYLNNIASVEVNQIPTTNSNQTQQPNMFTTFLTHSNRQDQENHVEKHAMNSSVAASSTGSAQNVFASIPFVQIHTTDMQPQRTNFGNVFRRNVSKQEEIKSEPIKSENTDSITKERVNATPTPPSRTNSQVSNGSIATEMIESMTTESKEKNNENHHSGQELQLYKCSKCPFISLNESARTEHLVLNHRDVNQTKVQQSIDCPGCSNIFYARKSLEMHLQLDHMMSEEDVIKLMENCLKPIAKQLLKLNLNNTQSTGQTLNSQQAPQEIQRKSRIYLKNVECLREPNRQPIEQNHNQICESNTERIDNQMVKNANPPKQKISIKSVDVLREPALLRRDYEMQNGFNTFTPNNNDDQINLNVVPQFNYSQPAESIENDCKTVSDNNNESLDHVGGGKEPMQKSRKPKIYVKSVESFNLMPSSSLPISTTNYLNENHALAGNSQIYDTNLVHLPFLYDNNSVNNNLSNGSNSFLNNPNDSDNFQFLNNTSHSGNKSNNNNYLLDNALFSSNTLDCALNTTPVEGLPLITEPTPPPNSSHATELDFNLKKTPSYSGLAQEQRGTLHLRTVDELNLMNKNEVQNLIAPNLDNNHSIGFIDKTSSINLDAINMLGDNFYPDESFKFHDLDTQMVNEWSDNYEELAEDINCIIAEAPSNLVTDNLSPNTKNTQKVSSANVDIDTPQVTLISIRDIEELTGGTLMQNTLSMEESSSQQVTFTDQLSINEGNEVPSENVNVNVNNGNFSLQMEIPQRQIDSNDNNLKRELNNCTPDEVPAKDKSHAEGTTKQTIINLTATLPPLSDVPPLVPVSNTIARMDPIQCHTKTQRSNNCNDIPLPPLVPMSPLIKLNATAASKSSGPASKAPLEKGRIYVANNLMEEPKQPVVVVSTTSGTSVRGRPFGSNRTGITKLSQDSIQAAEAFLKCSLKGCAFRFKKSETLDYHRKCHDENSKSPQAAFCPECKSHDFNNWNTLHTHLWRNHRIDMELYSCELCSFKTPVYSRLINTHAKIHFDDRNYKCDQCEKAFKNSKQLKNHRRWHRTRTGNRDTNTLKELAAMHRCAHCGALFSQLKSLRGHFCKNRETQLQCDVCQKSVSSRASLKLHMLTHCDSDKRYKCQNCDYSTNDHNAYRRHKMSHEQKKMYQCPYCDYKSVQSVAYQKHMHQKHPNQVDSVIHKCSQCLFSTINRTLLTVHQAKHEVSNNQQKNDNSVKLLKTKIKVKSNLFTTSNLPTMGNNSNNTNTVQYFSVDNNIT